MLGPDRGAHRVAQTALLGQALAVPGLSGPRGPSVKVAFKTEAVAAELLAQLLQSPGQGEPAAARGGLLRETHNERAGLEGVVERVGPKRWAGGRGISTDRPSEPLFGPAKPSTPITVHEATEQHRLRLLGALWRSDTVNIALEGQTQPPATLPYAGLSFLTPLH